MIIVLILVASLFYSTLSQSSNPPNIVIDRYPYQQEIVCQDCVEPVQIQAQGLPDFLNLNGNTLQTTSIPKTGQYNVSLDVKDGSGITVRTWVIVLCQQKNQNHMQRQSLQGDAIINIYSEQLLTNLTTLLLNPNNLTQSQIQIQKILGRQAAINNKIVNLLILIRRYTNTNNILESQLDGVSLQIEKLLPKQSQIDEELLLLENRMKINKKMSDELIGMIKELRQLIRMGDTKISELEQQKKDMIDIQHSQNNKKMALEAEIQIRKQILQKMVKQTTGCQQQAITEQKQLLDQIDNETNDLDAKLAEKNQQISDYDSLIEDLKRQLEETRDKKQNATKDRYQLLMAITNIQNQRSLITDKLQNITKICLMAQQDSILKKQNIQNIIDELQSELQSIKQNLRGLEPKLTQIEAELLENERILRQNIHTLDEKIGQLGKNYQDTDQAKKRIIQLKQQKGSVDSEIKKIEQIMENYINAASINNQALRNTKEQLAKAMQEKQVNDQEIQNLLLRNLDIIRSVMGNGAFKFDKEQILKITGVDTDSLDSTNIYELNHDEQGNQQCDNNVMFYGLGEIYEVSEGKITIISQSSNKIDLYTPVCSINMAIKEEYRPENGDLICWKGYRLNRKWYITESIVIPSQK